MTPETIDKIKLYAVIWTEEGRKEYGVPKDEIIILVQYGLPRRHQVVAILTNVLPNARVVIPFNDCSLTLAPSSQSHYYQSNKI